jgi:hypothetical protein
MSGLGIPGIVSSGSLVGVFYFGCWFGFVCLVVYFRVVLVGGR